MKGLRTVMKITALVVVYLLISVAFMPAVTANFDGIPEMDTETRGPEQIPGPFRNLRTFVIDLIDATPSPENTYDEDNDGLPDSVEWVIGTDYTRSDTDFDRIDDYQEVMNNMDPTEPDSNHDGMPDYYEVTDVEEDIDGDGLPNVWDWDNDGDGVYDEMDISPYVNTDVRSSFQFDVSTSGNPVYLTIQVRTKNPDNMRLYDQHWDWPYDDEGMMRDIDNSDDDVRVTPMLEFTSDTLPVGPELEEYGLSVQGDTMYVPVFPVWEFGNVVAFKAKIFYPATGVPQQIGGDLKLSWKVKGLSDSTSMALGYFSSGYRYTFVNDEGMAVAESPVLGEEETFYWIESREDYGGFESMDGRTLTIDDQGYLVARTKPLNEMGYFEVEEVGARKLLRAYNGKYLSIQTNGTIIADSISSTGNELLAVVNHGVEAKSTTLAYYYEDFAVTGIVAEENFGTDVAVLYGDNITHTIAANLRLSYQFLRNSTTTVDDIDTLLEEHEIPLDNNVSKFAHRDTAARAVMVEMIKEAKDKIPEDEIRPIIMAMETRSKAIVLSEVNDSSRAGGKIVIDFATVESETSKTLRTSWYEADRNLPVDIGDVITYVQNVNAEVLYGLDLAEKAVTGALLTVWNVGETFVTKIGDQDPGNLKFPEDNDIVLVVGDVMQKGLSAIKALATIIQVGKAAYDFLKITKFSKVFTEPLSSLKSFSKIYKTVGKVNTGFMKIVNKIGAVLDVIGLVIDIGIAIYCMFAIAESMDWSTVGVAMGVVYAVMMVVYAVVLFAIGLIPVVGWIIALVISLSDAITGWIFGKGWSQMLMEAIIDLITDFNTLTEANITMTDAETNIDDKDHNGLDVGDRIEYKSYVTGRINRTSDGHWRDVLQSYIIPSYTLSIPPNTGSLSGTYTDVADERLDPYYKYKETDYEVGAWFEPGIPMINFPMTIAFKTDMRVYSEECWWAVVWWCERKANTCSTTADPSTLYFDVMPGSIDEFAKWRGIHSTDYDGDGLNNTDEEWTDAWKWDSDGDGLGDDYEYEIGTRPWMYDSDRDGLDDKTEHLWGTDPDDKDTDDDGLNDYIEHNGWVVNFDYFDDNFNWHITSNPLLNNTDADAVNDYMEYRTLQNPMSKDTNGDGIEDQTKDYYDTQFVHRKNIAESFYPRAMAVDENGNTYVATNKDSVGTYADCFVKYNRQGFMDTYYYRWGTNTLDRIEDMRMGPDGKLYVADRTHGILRFKPNGAYDNWRIYHIDQTGFYNPTAIAFDGEDHLLAVSGFTHDVWVFNIAPAKPTVVDRWGGMSTTVDGKFDTPNGIDFHPDGYVYVSDESNRVQKLHPNGTHIDTWMGTVTGSFNDVQDVDVDVDGNVFITDKGSHHIFKVDVNGSWQKTLGAKGSGDGQFEEPWEMTITPENDIYVVDSRNYRIQKMWQEVVFVPATPPVTFLDTDGDGFEDADEANEWTVTLVNASGTISFNVSSDIMVPDTDNDGLNDLKEFQLKTNPRSPDTDGDGVPDGEELALGTNLTHWDTDIDGLDDAIEITFGSDPRLEDSDNDGLFDHLEWQYGSDPRSQDTDKDGLGDLEEALVASNLTNADSDGDFMFDGMEADWGTSPTNPDWDGDGLDDGYEVFFSTDPKKGDTDGDNLLDAFELGMKMNPLSNDTDGDTLLDSTELDMGLNPKSRDSDGDGVPDNLDLDYAVELQQKVYLAIDPVGNMTRFIDGLIDLIGVEIVEPGTLLSAHRNARYIVLVGDPSSGPGTVGSVIRGLLEDTPDLLEQMETSDGYHIAVRYGTWAHTQTIVMISHPYPSDHIRVAGILRSMEMTVTDGAVAVTYLNPRSCFKLDDADTVRQTDTVVWTKLDEMATFSVEISKYTEDDAPYELTITNGLEPGDEVMGKYITVEVSESIQTNLTDMVSGSSLRLYYTEKDLDMTGDGDADDEDDLNELTLCLYRYDEETETWVKVREDLSWVTEAGVNTTDVEMYGKQYAGYVYAEISHFSHFGAGGRPNTFLPTVANAGEDFDGLTHQIITFNGTTSEGNGELNYTWTLYHRSQLVTLYDPTPTFTFTEPGDYIVTLLVKDDYNVIDGDTVFVSIISLADEMFDLEVGPIVDVHGDPVEGAKVRVTVSDFRFFGVTDADGIADVEIAMAFQGREIEVFVVKSGHEPLKFDTNITMDGQLDRVPPTFYRELFEVVAHAGIDRVGYMDEETMLDGSLSRGNGGIAEYTWTFQHKGGKRILEGATPTFVFEEEDSYLVTLTVTDFRGLTAETTVTLTVIPRPTDEFTLFVGPLMDKHNLPIEGASVELTIGEEVFTGYTMADGVAYIVLPGDHKGQNVEVYIQGDDFAPVSFFTIITPEGEMERAVPSVESTADWTDPGETEGGTPAWVIGAIVAVIVVLVLMFLILTKRIGGKKEDDLDDLGTEDGGVTEEAEPGTEEELEDATIVVDGPEEASVGEGPEVEPEEDLHAATAPSPITEEVPPKVDFKDLPRSTSRNLPVTPVEPRVDEKDLNSVAVDSEVDDPAENKDTDI